MESYRSWASKVIPDGEQFGFWQETVGAVLGPMEVERDGDGSFPARLVQTPVGALTLSSVRAAPHRSRRGDRG